MIDKEAIAKHIRGILIALGDNPDREGLKDTPVRVANMYEEIFEGMNYSNHQIAEMFNKCFDEGIDTENTSKVVVMKDIDFFSHCEHHLASCARFRGCPRCTHHPPRSQAGQYQGHSSTRWHRPREGPRLRDREDHR